MFAFPKNILYFSLIVVFSFPALSQDLDTSSTVSQVDSSQIKIQNYKNLVEESVFRKRADSLLKLELIEKISLLKERDQLKQAELIGQIKEIEQKDSLRNTARNEKILEMKQTTKGFPVAPFGDTLCTVYIKIGPVHPKERAASITKKIEILYRDDSFVADSLKVIASESTVDIAYGEMILMSVTDWDALWEDKTKDQLANQLAQNIKVAIALELKNNSLKNILIRTALTLLIILIAYVLVFFLKRAFRRLAGWVRSKEDIYFKGFKLRNYEILPPKRELELALQLVTVLKGIVFFMVLYIALPIIFSLFPFTKGWANTLFDWVWNPAKEIFSAFWNYLPNVFSIVVIYFVTHYATKLIRFISHEVEAGRLTLSGFHKDWAAPTFNIVRFLLYAFMFIVIFPYLPGSSSPIFQGVSVFLGILFSLGSSTAIANAVAGLVITYMRPFQLGDRVKIGEVTGQVIEKSLLVTRVKTVKNEYITVPNASILTGHTINYSTAKESDEGLILHTSVTIGYDISWRKVHELLIAAAEASEGVITSKKPFVLQTSLDDNYVSYQLNAYTDLPDRMAWVYSNLHQNIQDKFNEAGVEILSPHYRAVRDGHQVGLPLEYLPKDYKSPSFKIEKDK
ncbi:MAG: small-conductance mechanosensitive channel [Marinoscillum sp.]